MLPTLIRLATLADASACRAAYAPVVEHTPISFELEPPSVEEMAARIEKTLVRLPWLVCERDGLVLGYAYASLHGERPAYRWAVNVSVYVHPDGRRSGLGRALYTALFEVLRMMGYRAAYAGVTLPNPASVGLHERMGFTPVGVYRQVGYKFGAWHDVGWWQFGLAERVPEPPEPLHLPDVTNTEAWASALAAGAALLRD